MEKISDVYVKHFVEEELGIVLNYLEEIDISFKDKIEVRDRLYKIHGVLFRMHCFLDEGYKNIYLVLQRSLKDFQQCFIDYMVGNIILYKKTLLELKEVVRKMIKEL